MQGSGNHIGVTGVKCRLNRDNELGDNGEDLSITLLKEIEDTLNGKESVRILLLTDTLHEDRKVMMVIKLVDFDFPGNLVGGTVLDLDGKISAVVESTELTGRNNSASNGSSSRGNRFGLLCGLVKR